MIDNSKEYILCAALKRKEPKEIDTYWAETNDIHLIEIGYRHPDIRDRFLSEVSMSPRDQGFYTSKGRFVSRVEAMKIAKECGQIPEWHNNTILFSEDLY